MRAQVVVIGGGQAGLAMSRCLSDRQLEHVVLERGRVGERWRSERWDSLRMLTPAWQSRLPGLPPLGGRPDDFMDMREVVGLLEGYAASFSAPVETSTTVRSVAAIGGAFRVRTDRGDFLADHVVVATGHCDVPFVPGFARGLPDGIRQLTPSSYKRPSDVPEGGVLVVGASASGVQIAHELLAAGRAVTIAVGKHTRLPRSYRGKDIMWWLDAMGTLAERVEDAPDPAAWKRQPSFQLVGRRGETLDLAALSRAGARLVGRAADATGARVRFLDDLERTTAASDAKLAKLLARIDAFVDLWGLGRLVSPPERPAAFSTRGASTEIDLRRERIASVVWATGFRRRYPWLEVPVLGEDGEIVHEGGITCVPGLYALGLRYLRTRSSSFLDGVGRDAEALADHIARRAARARAAA